MSSTRRISPEEWDSYKEFISALYISQNKTLEDVITCLEVQHGFCATKAQYVRQLKKWGLEKNMKNNTWKFVADQIRKRKLEEKDSDIFVNGKLVPYKKVKKEISRNAPSVDYEQPSSLEALQGVIVKTPEAESIGAFYVNINVPWFQFQESLESCKQPHPVDQTVFIGLTSLPQHTFVGNSAGGDSYPELSSIDSWFATFFDVEKEPYHPSLGEQSLYSGPSETLADEEVDQGAGLLLENCLSGVTDLDSPDNEPDLCTRLDDITIERHEGDLVRHVNELHGPRAIDATYQMLRYWVYLITNNLLHGHQVDNVMTWLVQNKKLWVIENLVRSNSPTTQVLTSNLLGSAIRLQNVTFIRLLLANGADVNTVSTDEYQARTTALQEAVKLEDPGLVRLLLDSGADPNAYNQSGFGMTALRIAVDTHHDIEIAKMLIDAGAAVNDIDQLNMYGTLLKTAVSDDSFEFVHLLLEAKADVNHFDGQSGTALQNAMEMGDVTIVDRLLAAGADVDAPCGKCYKHARKEALRRACDEFVSLPIRTAIQIAAAEDNIELVQVLLDNGADADGCLAIRNILQTNHDDGDDSQRKSDGDNTNSEDQDEGSIQSENFRGIRDWDFFRTPLQSAVESDNSIMARLLLSAGADVNACTSGPTALQLAAKLGGMKMVRLLISKGADVNAAPPMRYPNSTALQEAAARGNEDIVQALLNAGALVNAHPFPDGGLTALQAACGAGSIDVVQILIAAGANINARAAPSRGRTCLQTAIEQGHDDIVHLLLKHGADINIPASERYGLTALQAAIRKNKKALVNRFLKAEAHAKEQTSKEGGTSSLFEAVRLGDRDLVQTLLQCGSDSNSITNGSALGLAVYNGDIETVRILLQAGAHVNLLDHGRQTPLQKAVEHGHLEIVQLLLDKGACINMNNLSEIHSQTPLQTAVGAGRADMVEFLLSKGANPKAQITGVKGPTVLSSISWAGRNTESIVRYLLEYGLDVKHASSDPSDQPLHKAATACQIEVVTMLLEAGANVNAPAVVEHQRTALQAAVAGGVKLLVANLLNAGADVNGLPAPKGEMALQIAVRRGDASLVKMLLDAGADVNALPAPDAETALQIAVGRGSIAIVRMLLSAGADVNAFYNTKSGKSPLQEAAARGSVRLVQLLLSRGADVNAPSGRDRGATALQAAAMKGYLRVAVMLLKSGADINAPAAAVCGRTALDGAAEQGRLDMVFLLLKNDKETDSIEIRCKRAAKLAASAGHLILAKILRDWKVSGKSSVVARWHD